MSEPQQRHSIFVYTQKDVANVAVSVSSTAVGATIGTIVAPGPGSVVGGFVGGLVGLAIERYIAESQQNSRKDRFGREAIGYGSVTLEAFRSVPDEFRELAAIEGGFNF